MDTQNQNVRYLIIGVLALIIVGVIIAIIALNNDSTEETATTEPEPQSTNTEQDPTDTTPDASPQPEESQPTPQQAPSNESTDVGTTETPTSQPVATPEPAPTPQPTAQYTDYTTAAFNQAVQDNKNIVLFFHANWCPTCRALDQEITSGLSRVPANTEVFKVDYDNSGGLTQDYGVTAQHTLVFLKGSATTPGSTVRGGGLEELIFQVESI